MMAGAVRALVLALLVALTDTHVSATQSSTLASPACFPWAQLVNPVRGDYGVRLALRLRGGRAVSDKKEGARGLTSVGEGGDATSDATERPVRPLPDVGEAMQAKIMKHRQMRKGRVPDDPAEAQAKLERKKKHDQRRERRDAHRVSIKKLKPKDHPRRPFMREREGGKMSRSALVPARRMVLPQTAQMARVEQQVEPLPRKRMLRGPARPLWHSATAPGRAAATWRPRRS